MVNKNSKIMSDKNPSVNSYKTAKTSLTFNNDENSSFGTERSFAYTSLTNYFNSYDSILSILYNEINHNLEEMVTSVANEEILETNPPIDRCNDPDDLHSYEDEELTSESLISHSSDFQKLNRRTSCKFYKVAGSGENNLLNLQSKQNQKTTSFFREAESFQKSDKLNSSNNNNIQRKKRLLLSYLFVKGREKLFGRLINDSSSSLESSNNMSSTSATNKSASVQCTSNSTTVSAKSTFKYYGIKPMSPMKSNFEDSCFSEKEMEIAFSGLDKVLRNHPFFEKVAHAILNVSMKYVLTIQNYSTRFISPLSAEFYVAACRIVKKYTSEKLDPIVLAERRFEWVKDYITGVNEFQVYLALRCGDIPHINYYYQFLNRIKSSLYLLYPSILDSKDINSNGSELHNCIIKQFSGYPDPLRYDSDTKPKILYQRKTIKDMCITLKFKLLKYLSERQLTCDQLYTSFIE